MGFKIYEEIYEEVFQGDNLLYNPDIVSEYFALLVSTKNFSTAIKSRMRY